MISKKIEILVYTRWSDCDKIGKQPSVFVVPWRGNKKGGRYGLPDYEGYTRAGQAL